MYCTNPGCDCSGFPTRTPYVPGPTPQIFSGSGGTFRIVIEAKPGTGRSPVPTVNFTQCGTSSGVPRLQIESTRNMGNGNNPVCSPDGSYNVSGGIPGINPPDFTPTSDIINTLQSFAIWFTYQSPGYACTFAPGGGSYAYVNSAATAQFCDRMSAPQAFPPGDSLLTAQLMDMGGNVGPTAQIIVRVPTRTPTPTVTPTRPTATPTATATRTATQPAAGLVFAPNIVALSPAGTRTGTRASAATSSPKALPLSTATATASPAPT